MKTLAARTAFAVAFALAGGMSLPVVAADYDGDGNDDTAFRYPAFETPGAGWNTAPVLLSNSDATWRSRKHGVPAWAKKPGVRAISGDFNGDGLDDVAFHRPGSGWGTVPVLFARDDGSWSPTNYPVPGWANRSGMVAIPGDYNEDSRTDIAFHRPSGHWGSVPVLLALGDGSWRSVNRPAPEWANQPGAIAIRGDFDGNGRDDIAFHRPGGHWGFVPVLLSRGNGGWYPRNLPAPEWANQPGAVAVAGRFDDDALTDIAFHRPSGHWGSVPVLFAAGDGAWTSTNEPTPAWANAEAVRSTSGDFDGDGLTDIAFHSVPGWPSVSVLFARGDGRWHATNETVDLDANAPKTRGVAGDDNGHGMADLAFHRRDLSTPFSGNERSHVRTLLSGGSC